MNSTREEARISAMRQRLQAKMAEQEAARIAALELIRHHASHPQRRAVMAIKESLFNSLVYDGLVDPAGPALTEKGKHYLMGVKAA